MHVIYENIEGVFKILSYTVLSQKQFGDYGSGGSGCALESKLRETW